MTDDRHYERIRATAPTGPYGMLIRVTRETDTHVTGLHVGITGAERGQDSADVPLVVLDKTLILHRVRMRWNDRYGQLEPDPDVPVWTGTGAGKVPNPPSGPVIGPEAVIRDLGLAPNARIPASLPDPREPARAACRSCGAAVWWLAHETTGKRAPIECDPPGGTGRYKQGNIEVDLDRMTYRIAAKQGRPKGLHLNHFTTCPEGTYWGGNANKAGQKAQS